MYSQTLSQVIAPTVSRESEEQLQKNIGAHGSYNAYDYSHPPSAPVPAWPQDVKKHMWTPIWLTKSVLIVFAVGFWMMMLATGLLYHFSVENQGISVQKEANHYAWKYGPTACEYLGGSVMG